MSELTEKINFINLLKTTAKLPFVKIERDKFLETALRKHYDDETVQKAIQYNPAYAGIKVEEINKLAKESINYETTKVSAISFVAGIPGGLAMLGTIPADVAQYFGHILRILQKLVYLYGWQQLYDEDGELDDKTTTLLTIFTGVMFGVSGAANLIAKISLSAAERAGKVIARQALTKVALYRIVKKIATILGLKMTKDIFAKGVSKAIPIIGGVASGGLTFATYKPLAERLRKHLATLRFADVEYYKNNQYDVIDIDGFVEDDGIDEESNITEDKDVKEYEKELEEEIAEFIVEQ